MLTTADLEVILGEISLQNTIFDLDWKFEIERAHPGFLVRVGFNRPDTETGVTSRGYSRREFIGADASRSSIVKTAWLLLELTVRHELMEGFRWRGCRIFNPHHTVEELASLEKSHETFHERFAKP